MEMLSKYPWISKSTRAPTWLDLMQHSALWVPVVASMASIKEFTSERRRRATIFSSSLAALEEAD